MELCSDMFGYYRFFCHRKLATMLISLLRLLDGFVQSEIKNNYQGLIDHIKSKEDEMNIARRSKKKNLIAFLISISIVISGTVYADEITDTIQEAIEYYEEGDFVEAASSLDYASQLIRQKRSGGLEAFLPEPLSGWSAADVESQAAGAAYLGGMITATRKYRKEQSSITIEILTDSPMLQSMVMMLSNPAYATADGGKLTKIKRQKAVIKYRPSNKDGEINIVVAKKYLVAVKGRKIKEADLVDYASAIDYKKLRQF